MQARSRYVSLLTCAISIVMFSLSAHESCVTKPWMKEFQNNLPKLPIDPLSNAEPEKAVTTHLIWNVEPNFEEKKLIAQAIYTYVNKQEGNDFLTLDVSNLEIQKILVNGSPSNYTIVSSSTPSKPDGLKISIPPTEKQGTVEIQYQTSKESTSLFWIDKEYTHGKNYPLLYTLFQENEGASAIPGQHSPQVRMTYEVNAQLKDPHLMVLSSVSNNPRTLSETGSYQGLSIQRAVPLYLLSLQIGNFSFKAYESDPRTGVYGEVQMVDEVAQTFSFLPGVMKAAEEVCGPYSWGTYTPVLLTWAFPYMAMEHPCASTCGAITLEHPSVIPHELAHSWAGNDITNATWQQFFWNEGLTTYIEHQICKKVWGDDYASMLILYTLEETKLAMDEYREKRPDLLRLCQQTTDREFTRIPYGKGALFFFMLENAMGSSVFDRFLKDYMAIFFENSMSDQRFLAYLKLWLEKETDLKDFDVFLKTHQIYEWLYDLEIPSNAPKFYSRLIDEFNREKEKIENFEKLDIKKIQGWDVNMKSLFLGSLTDLTSEHLAFLDQQLKFTQSNKMSIREEWARLCSAAGYLTPDTCQMIVDYIIERNSRHKANQIAALLTKTMEGKAVLQMILSQEQGRLFPLVKQKIEQNLQQ